MSKIKYAGGLVVYRVAPSHKYEYLLLKSSFPPFHWTPPKGHVDPGETDHLVTAWRETQEEAGLGKDDLLLEDNFKDVIEYEVRGRPKKVTYWLAKLKEGRNGDVTLSDEHTDFAWGDLAQTSKLVGYPTTSALIERCHQYLIAKYNS